MLAFGTMTRIHGHLSRDVLITTVPVGKLQFPLANSSIAEQEQRGDVGAQVPVDAGKDVLSRRPRLNLSWRWRCQRLSCSLVKVL